MPELLIELLSEEIPARMQARAAEDFQRLMCEGLAKARLSFDRAVSYVTPRRLALVVDGLPLRQPDVTEERRGPRVGAPDKAIEGFLKAAGLASIDAADVRETPKGEFYFATTVQPGRPAREALAEIIAAAIAAMPWPKSMRWGAAQFRWVRPLHNVLAIFDGAPVPFVLSLDPHQKQGGMEGSALEANDRTSGHRFLTHRWFEVVSASDYQESLRDHKVILDQDSRRRIIHEQAEDLASSEGLRLSDDPALLNEVTGLVEWPVVLMGRIDDAFMDLPREVLVTAMRAHQKYFALLDASGALAPRFIVVANMETADGGAAIVAGNERVLRARLADARFFWDQDRKRTLDSRVDALKDRVFHAKLGSDFQRVERLEILARSLAPIVGADPELAVRAAHLCKADLTTEMVGEFPELQGIMGRYYALNDGEPADVADAVADHYKPQGPQERCPSAPVSICVALADKIDTLAGFFAIDEKPTGSKDPFALRRAALGVIRIIIENRLRLNLRTVFNDAIRAYPEFDETAAVQRTNELLDFFADRLKVHLRETGVRHDLIAAVFSGGGEDDLVRLLARVDALRDFLNSDDGANLLIAYRRASNIVRIEENKDKTSYDREVEEQLFTQEEEGALFQRLSALRPEIDAALKQERFGEAMARVASLRQPVDSFFDTVTVNCDDTEIRANRLKLLSRIRSALSEVADFAQIEG
ncbi:MAG: glycine--tRNA ligase subunit beta [Hyphomicrobiales bacterium]|nr:glycine--tRNA ligase subunit beta [Hyphomicrobiales bacterium]